MESRRTFTANERRGITLLEMILVIAISAFILMLGMPITWDFYRQNELRGEAQNLTSYLETARSLSMANKNQAPHGLYISAQNYTIFQGASYAARDLTQDQIFPKSRIVTSSGASEIIFQQLSGGVSSTSISLYNSLSTTTMNINSEGVIQ